MAENKTPVQLEVSGFEAREVMLVDYKFNQEVDREGQIAGIPRGGRITIRVKAMNDGNNQLLQWMLSANDPRDVKISFANTTIHSKNLTVNLANCKKITLMAATIGIRFDNLLKRIQLENPAQAAILQACGAMYTEELVDLTCQKIKLEAQEENYKIHQYF